VEQRGPAVGQHVDGERDHPDQLDQVAAHDRSAAAGTDFTKLRFGRKLFGYIFILKFRTNFYPKYNIYLYLYEYFER
jgi:hypothetical protein